MAGLGRFLSVLSLFDESRPNWTVQEVADAVNAPTSTVYRTVAELVARGFLEPSTEAHYRLGPAFIEFDRRIRLTDPLVKAGGSLLRDLVAEARVPCVAVLARLYGDRVICAADERSAAAADIFTSYERGRPMPITRGATSKVILAQLSARRLTKLLKQDPDASRSPELRAELNAIRKTGYCVTRAEVDPTNLGLAAPVVAPDLAIVASLSLVLDAGAVDQAQEHRLLLLLIGAAGMLTQELRRVAQAAQAEGARSSAS